MLDRGKGLGMFDFWKFPDAVRGLGFFWEVPRVSQVLRRLPGVSPELLEEASGYCFEDFEFVTLRFQTVGFLGLNSLTGSILLYSLGIQTPKSLCPGNLL